MWEPNPFLRFGVGERYTIHTKPPDRFALTGTCTMSSPTEVWLRHAGGIHVIRTGAILRIDNYVS